MRKINPNFILILIFILSRAIYWFLGVRFDSSPLDWFIQYLDPHLLKSKLLESLFYLQSQPPLFNLFLGSVLKFFSGYENLVFSLIYFLFGLILYLGIYKIMSMLEISFWVRFILSTVFIVSPASITYENWLFYSYPTTAILVLSVFCLFMFLEKKKPFYLHFYFWLLLSLCLIRSTFHIAYFIFMIIFSIRLIKDKKKVLMASLVPLLIISALYLKNLTLFQTVSMFPPVGMDIANKTIKYAPIYEIEKLIKEKKLDILVLAKTYTSLDKYPSKYLENKKYKNIEALSQVKKESGYINLNNYAYIQVSKDFFKNAMLFFYYKPMLFIKAYFQSTVNAFLLYFCPSTFDYEFTNSNLGKIKAIDDFFNKFIYFQVSLPSGAMLFLTLNVCLQAIFWFSVLVSVGFVKLQIDQLKLTIIRVMTFNIAFVTLICNLFIIGENNRYRFEIDPFYLIMFGVLIEYFKELKTLLLKSATNIYEA